MNITFKKNVDEVLEKFDDSCFLDKDYADFLGIESKCDVNIIGFVVIKRKNGDLLQFSTCDNKASGRVLIKSAKSTTDFDYKRGVAVFFCKIINKDCERGTSVGFGVSFYEFKDNTSSLNRMKVKIDGNVHFIRQWLLAVEEEL